MRKRLFTLYMYFCMFIYKCCGRRAKQRLHNRLPCRAPLDPPKTLKNTCSEPLRAAKPLEPPRAQLWMATSLEIAARACLGTPKPFEIAARTSFWTAKSLEIIARTSLVTTKKLESRPGHHLGQPNRSKSLRGHNLGLGTTKSFCLGATRLDTLWLVQVYARVLSCIYIYNINMCVHVHTHVCVFRCGFAYVAVQRQASRAK